MPVTTIHHQAGISMTLFFKLKSIAILFFVFFTSIVFAQSPAITSFSPASGTTGTLVTITGTDLLNPTAMTVGGKTAIVISNTGTTMVAMVMPGAVDGVISITTSGGTATSESNFVPGPAIVANSQQGTKLVGNDLSGMARGGISVSLSADGNTAAVGGYGDSSGKGSVWIWIRTAGMWTQQGPKLVGSDIIGASAQQGWSLALSADGNTLIVGGNYDNNKMGAVWIFTRSMGVWTQQGKLIGTNAVGTQPNQGHSVDISADGNTVLVGGYNDDSGVGAAWVWIRSGGAWTEQGPKLIGNNAVGKANQGMAVALSADGNTAMLGGRDDNNKTGAVWVFTRSGSAWTQQGDKLVGTGSGMAAQGTDIALSADGNTAIIAAMADEYQNPGAVWFWIRSGSTWTQQGNIAVKGASVAMSADGNVAIAGDGNDSSNIGAVFVYKRNNGTWTLSHKIVGSGGVSSLQGAGSAISADGSTIMSGGPFDASLKGAAWAFTYMPPPTITSFTPVSTVSGSTVTITGTNFTGSTNVSFGGTAAASFTVDSPTQISAVVGTGSNGDVSVTSSRGTATLAGFTIPVPSITSFSPASGPVGTLLTVTGSNLNKASLLSIGGKNAIVVSSTGPSLSALVMPGTTDGIISLTTGGGTVTTGSFTITAAKPLSSQQKIATGGPGAISLGVSVAVSADGNTAVVGAPGENADQGGAWVYIRSGSGWVQEAKLVGTVNSRAARQGSSVSISADGNTVMMGGGTTATTSRGALWFFTRSNGVWSEQGTQVVTLTTAPTPSHDFSTSLSADGNTALAGAFGDGNNRGAVWVYVRTAGTWAQQGSKLIATGNVGFFPRSGFAVSLSADGNTALIGGDGDDSDKGAAWVFTRTGVTWTQQTKLIGTGNTGAAKQGSSVSLSADGNIAIVGGLADSGSQGASWIYNRNGTVWTQQTVLIGTGSTGAAKQGSSVSLNADGSIAIIGGEDDNSGQGAAWVFTRTGNTWTQNGTKLSGTDGVGSSHQGHSVSLSADGNSAVIGGNADNSNQGAVWAFTPTPPPAITSFTPASAAAGSTITLTGTDFTGATEVSFGGIAAASFTVVSPTSIIAVLNNGASGVLSVTTPYGSGTLAGFTFLSNNADLLAFALSSGALDPVFAPGTLQYTSSVSNATSSIIITPTVADASATVKVNDTSVANGSASEGINLSVGSNTITIGITAPDGVTNKTYTLVITRAPSSNADLLTLALSAGTLDPVFAASTFSYTTYVSNATSSITLEPGAANTNANINVNGIALISGTISGNIDLVVGNNSISISVRSEDGAIAKNYTVKVIRLGADQVLPDQSGDASVNNTVTQVVVVSPTQPVVITVHAGTVSPSIDYGSLITAGTGTIPQTTVNSAIAQLTIPAATEVTALGTGWDGVLSAPAITTYDLPQTPGQIITTGLIIEVGSPDYSLSFNKAVRLTLTRQAGMRIARVHNNIYSEITLTGSEDSQAAGDALPADGTFKIDVGADMVIWTKVFSKYITFSQITDLNVALVQGDKSELTADLIKGSNTDLSTIKSQLVLPVTGTFGSSITWTSSDPAVVSADGKTIVRTLSGSGSRTATITASIRKGLITETKSFNLIIPELANQAPTLADIASQTLCYTGLAQVITLSGISAGPEAGQTTAITVNSDKPAMFSQLSTTGNTLSYRLNEGVSGVAIITVTVKDNGATTDGGIDTYTRTFTVTVNPLPVAVISNDTGAEISKGFTASLSASGGTTYVWATAAGIISGQQTATLLVRPSVTTTYTVTATSQAGCSASTRFTLNVKEDFLALDINNLMTPNGDGVNDYLVIKNLDMYPNNTVKVFDREGRQLYARTNYTNDWDGSFNGSPLDENTYFYIVDFGSGRTKLKGFVSIVR